MSGIVNLCDSDEERDPPLSRALCRAVAGDVFAFARGTEVVDNSDDERAPILKKRRKRQAFQMERGSVQLEPSMPNECVDLTDDRKMPAIAEAGRKRAAVTNATVEQALMPECRTPVLQVYEVFPDVDPIYAKNLLALHGDDVATVLSIMAAENFPKSQMTTVAEYNNGATVHKAVTLAPPVWTYDFMSANSFQATRDYTQEATQQLLNDFPFLAKAGVTNFLKSKGHYAICHDFICNMVIGRIGAAPTDDEALYKEYTILKNAVRHGILDNAQVQRFQSPRKNRYTVKRHRKAPTACIVTDPILLEEIKYVRDKHSVLTKRMEAYKVRLDAREAAESTNSTVDCLCCYTSVAIEEMIQCQKEGHLFCIDCVRRFAETQVFGAGNLGINRETKEAATELLCMFADGCSSGFGVASLEKALPAMTMAKYNEMQFHAAIAKADLKDLV